MAVPFVPMVEPEYDASVDSAVNEQRGSYRFFKGEHGDKIQFVKPKYSADKKPLTVFRPFPCRSFTNPKGFEPYRKDTGGKNFLGYWVKRIQAVVNVGNPGISYICHNPKDGIFDDRFHPYGVLQRAVRYAVKKGQGKAEAWAALVRPPEVEPDAKSCLSWAGMLEGGKGKGAVLPRPGEMFLMQGMLLVDDSKKTFGDGKAPIGWGQNPTCVLGLTKGVGNAFMKLLNDEHETFRGAPDDFEKRYVNGDPVGPESGRFLFIYPKGGDPRQGQYASKPVDVDPFAQTAGGHRGAQGGEKKDDVGFDCHLAPNYEKTGAAMKLEQQKAMMAAKWLHWEDAFDRTGRRLVSGLLWYPTYVEQAQMLARVLPADMLLYAFYGEHNDWLTEDIRRKAVEARSIVVPGISSGSGPNYVTPPTSAGPAAPFGESFGSDPFSGGEPDSALASPEGELNVDIDAGSSSADLGAAFDALNAAYTPAPAAPTAAPAGSAVSEEKWNGAADKTAAFDPPPASSSAGALAAVRAKLKAAQAAKDGGLLSDPVPH